MKTRLALLLLLTPIISLPLRAAHAEGAASRLISVLSCEENASPTEVASLIDALGGHTVVRAAAATDADYTLPNPINVFGQPVTVISVHPGSNADGDFTEYRSLFTAPAMVVARYAGIEPYQGIYKRQTGNNDVLLRFEPGGSYIVCEQGVRSVSKWIRREVRNLNQSQSIRR